MATLVAINIGLIGATCDPNNQPPNAPKARVAEYDATSITIVFGNNCIDPDNTGWCHQQVIVTGGSQSAFTIKATGGVAVIPNRLPGQTYDIFLSHIDEGGQRTNGETIYDFKTAGITGPKVTGLAPTEAVPGTAINLYGIWFDTSVTVRLVDPRNGASYPASILAFAPGRITVSLPTPANLGTGRKPFFLVTNTNNKVDVQADLIYISSSPTLIPPPGQKIAFSFIRWQPSARCTGLLCGDCKAIDGWYPPVRDALRGGAGAPTGDDWWPDTWADPFWAHFKLLVDDTAREWNAMCSESWGSTAKVGGAASVYPQVTLPSGSNYWFEIAVNDDDMYRLAERLRNAPGGYLPFCTESGGDFPRTQPDDCSKWKANSNTHINVHLVGVFLERNIEIDPVQLRGITNLPNSNTTNTDGVIILTDNPQRGSRKLHKPILINGVPSSEECISHYYSAADPVGLTYWWGPQAGSGYSHSPNVLTHEAHHATTGYVHIESEPDPCWTPAVGQPTDSCGRGFKMALTNSLTTDVMCKRVVNGIDGNDYTN